MKTNEIPTSEDIRKEAKDRFEESRKDLMQHYFNRIKSRSKDEFSGMNVLIWVRERDFYEGAKWMLEQMSFWALNIK